MKKHIIHLIVILLSMMQPLVAQVGIATDPENGSILHVKGSDTDVIIDSITGRVGIGVARSALQEKLEVKGNTSINGTATINGNLTTNGKVLARDTLTTVNTAGHTPAAALEIVSENSALPALMIEDGDYADGKYIMADAQGNAVWKNLAPPLEIVGFDENTKVLKPLHDVPTSGSTRRVVATSYLNSQDGYLYISNYTDITDHPLVLGKGKWLVMAQYRTLAVTNNQSPSMIYTALVSRPTATPTAQYKKETIFGVQPEQKGDSRGTPQLFTVVTVEEETEFRIYSMSVNSPYVLQKNNAQASSFFAALKLSEE